MKQNGSLVSPEILVVDDEIDIRELMAGILADEGYETRVASDSDGLLHAIAQRRPHLVVLDVWLQGSRLDGIQVLDILQREYPIFPSLSSAVMARSKPRSPRSKRAPTISSKSRSRPTNCVTRCAAPWKPRV
jgi:CheY-like chemotaxis protein